MNNSVLSFNLILDYYVFLLSSHVRDPGRYGVSCRGTQGEVMRTQGQNKKAAAQSLCCQLDKYNVSPIKYSLLFFNSAEALLTAAWQGGCRSSHCLCDQHHYNRGPCSPILLKPQPFPLACKWDIHLAALFQQKKMTIHVFDFHLFFWENKEFYSFRFLLKKNLFGVFL